MGGYNLLSLTPTTAPSFPIKIDSTSYLIPLLLQTNPTSSPFCNTSPSRFRTDPTSLAIKFNRSPPPPPQGQRSDESRMTRIKMEFCSKWLYSTSSTKSMLKTFYFVSLYGRSAPSESSHTNSFIIILTRSSIQEY